MDKLFRLREIVKSLNSTAVAFSAGVDSTLLAKVAYEQLGENAIAVTAASHSLPESELKDAQKIARQIGIKHVILKYEETDNPDYAANPVNRCYFCKTMLYAKMSDFIKKQGIETIINGLNKDDLRDIRPGMQAGTEYRVRSPLLEADLTKREIREISLQLGLPTWEKPEMACLASRIPTGVEVTIERLRIVERAEEYLKNLGVCQVRVRHHENVARIQVEESDIGIIISNASLIRENLQPLGYEHITLDLKNYSRP